MPTVTFKRPRQYADMLRAYSVVIDGVVVGTLRRGEELQRTVSPGRHEFQAKIDWCSSPCFESEVFEDTCIEVSSNLTGWRCLLALWHITLGTKSYLRIGRGLTTDCS